MKNLINKVKNWNKSSLIGLDGLFFIISVGTPTIALFVKFIIDLNIKF